MAISENLVATALPTPTGEGRNVYQRGDGYGNAFTRPLGKGSANVAASEGYYILRNGTVGTGTTGLDTPTAVSDTQAFIHVFNNAASGSGKNYALDYLKIKVGTAGASSTTTAFFMKCYRGSTRYASGGTAFTATNCNAASTATASVDCQAGAVTLAAANGTERLLSAEQIRSVIAVAGDHYWFDFGAPMSAHNHLVVSGTAISNLVMPVAPVVLGPQSGFQFGIYGASHATGAVYEWELGLYQL